MTYYLGGPMRYFYLMSPGATVHTVPYGTNLFRAGIPGSKLPGYYRSVPTGQKPPDTCPEIDSTPPENEYEDDKLARHPQDFQLDGLGA
jgi:hypothetical protein